MRYRVEWTDKNWCTHFETVNANTREEAEEGFTQDLRVLGVESVVQVKERTGHMKTGKFVQAEPQTRTHTRPAVAPVRDEEEVEVEPTAYSVTWIDKQDKRHTETVCACTRSEARTAFVRGVKYVESITEQTK